MISSVLLSILATPFATGLPASPASMLTAPSQPNAILQDEQEEIDAPQEIAAAGDDIEKVLELARTWKTDGKSKEAKLAFTRAVELDDANEEAHKGLRHHFYDSQWFTSYSAMSKYRREETKRKADEGFSRLGDDWVLTADLPFLRMGWTKSEAGKWLDPAILREMKFEQEMIAEGRKLRQEDGTWIHPDNFAKWEEGLWKCGEEWLSKDEANTYHAEITQWWEARSDHFNVKTTCDMDTMLWARWHAENTYADLAKIFGLKPATRPTVVVFKNIEQFNAFAAGEQGVRQPAEASGFSSLHYAYFADSWYDLNSQPPQYLGTGIAYWDAADPKLTPFGKHSVRHAAGLAYIEKIAPSLNTLSAAIASSSPPDLGAFWSEKPIPRWLFYGAASYVERYYSDGDAENPWWPREWSLANLRAQGEIDPFTKIFEFGLNLEDIAGSTRLISEAGLVVSFIMDGGCVPVIEAHGAYKAALRSGKATPEVATALQDALIANQGAFDDYLLGT